MTNKDMDIETKEESFRNSREAEARLNAKKNNTDITDELQNFDDDKSDDIEVDKPGAER
tara:strand:- start:673 stop:849 length:177 start_codon:yes stop_codon:yes gene_type:complete